MHFTPEQQMGLPPRQWPLNRLDNKEIRRTQLSLLLLTGAFRDEATVHQEGIGSADGKDGRVADA